MTDVTPSNECLGEEAKAEEARAKAKTVEGEVSRALYIYDSRPTIVTVVVDTIAFAVIAFMNLTMISSNMFTGYWHMLDPWNLGFSLWGIIPSICGYVVIPCLSCIPFFWRLLRDEKYRNLFRIITIFFYATMTQVSPLWRTIAIMVGTGLGLAQFMTCITETELLGIGNGMFLMITTRWALSSLLPNDLVINWAPAWAYYVVGFLSVAWLAVGPSHVHGISIEKRNPQVKPFFTPFASWACANVIILHTWLFTSDATLVRWAKYESYPAGIIIILALFLGVVVQYTWYIMQPWRIHLNIIMSTSMLCGAILLLVNVRKSIEYEPVYVGNGNMIMAGGFLIGIALPFMTTLSFTALKLGLDSLRSRIRFSFVLLSGVFMVIGYIFLFLWLLGKMAMNIEAFNFFHGNVTFLLPIIIIPIIVCVNIIYFFILKEREDGGFAQIDVSITKYSKAMAIVWGIAFVAIFLPALRMRSWYVASRGTIDTPVTFTVMTWNIQEGYEAYVSVHGRASVGMVNLERQSNVISKYKPHIVCLQESDSAHPLTGNRDLPGYLAERNGYYVEYGAPAFLATPGVATLSALPLTYQTTYMMPKLDAALNRLMIAVGFPYLDPISLEKGTIHVFNTHAEWFNEGARVAQVSFIKEKIALTSGPAVFMGDFNMNISMLSPIWKPEPDVSKPQPIMLPVNFTLKADNVSTNYFTEIIGDPPGTGKKMEIDHIFYRDLCLLGFKTPQTYGISDHLPVLATFSTHDPVTGERCVTGPITWDKIDNPPKVNRVNTF